jgi:hypothetical protein
MTRLGAELLVIILGVMIALSADAWLQARNERSEEARHLQALREDFSESLKLLDAWHDEREVLSSALVSLLERDLDVVPVDSVGLWVYQGLWNIGTYEPRVTALRDLESTGELRLLSTDIRRAISEFNRRLGHLERLELDFIASQQGLVDPYLVTELRLAPILAMSDSLPISERLSAGVTWPELESSEARSLIAFKLSLAKVGTGRRERLAEQLDDLVTLIDDRLAVLGGSAGAG